ncbi:MAG: carboxypeptidase-like regulatory domain-containing protein [Bacteroidales bacterium]|nr:carboxypeptidase-like regulatory domain-containing protein [Bacteroidales bacterium]
MLILLFVFVACIVLPAQSTRVRGKVLDAATGEPIPFASVYFDNTTIGVSTDLEGNYSLETRSVDAKVLSASIIGYYSESFNVPKGSFSEHVFLLRQDVSQLKAALVKPDNRYIKSILRKIDQARAVHNPDNMEDWKSEIYTKIELDATNLEDLIDVPVINRNVGFIREFADTSVITGKASFPFMISESQSELYHSKERGINREYIKASRISGFREENTMSQFTGSYLLKTNFYDSSIDVFKLRIPNPAAESSQIFYNYFLVDSLNVQGRKTYVLRFHPKKLVTSPTLDGEMLIDAQDFAIRNVQATLSTESSVNWIRHIHVDVKSRRLPNGKWFPSEEELFLDLSVTLNDNSRMVSAVANRNMVFSEPRFEKVTEAEILSDKHQVIVKDVIAGDEAYWESVRPYELSNREKDIFRMVESIQDMPFYKWAYSIIHTLSVEYFEVKALKFEFGMWDHTVAVNDTEGLRIQLGGRTTHDLSETFRLGGYLAYGNKDREFKYNGTFEWMIGRQLTRKLDIWTKRDFEQLSGGSSVFNAQNIFSSLMSKGGPSMQSMVRTSAINYEHEFNPDFIAAIQYRNMRIWGNNSVPLQRQDGTFADSFGSDELRMSLRLTHDEKVTRNYFKKTYLYTSYPIFIVNFRYAFKGLSQDTFPHLRTEATLKWNTPSAAAGYGKILLGGGWISGSVPYPLLKLHEGNPTYYGNRLAFSCMNYYEFISDRWVNLFYEHNFNSFFLGKIPLIKELNLREVVTFRGAWGTLSKANKENAPFVLPYTADTLEVPYMEAGVGITNIFRFFRIDGFWRLSHRSDDASNNFALNFGLDFDF